MGLSEQPPNTIALYRPPEKLFSHQEGPFYRRLRKRYREKDDP